MTTKRYAIAATAIAAVCCCVAMLVGCPSEPSSVQPKTTPDASLTGEPTATSGHKLGMPVNSVSDIGYTLAEQGLVQWAKTAADTPTTQDAGTSETAIGVIGPGPASIEIGSMQFAPAAALTASDTNNAILKVWKRNAPDGGGGTTQTLLATASTFTPGKDGGTGNWNPWTPVNFTLVAGAYISPGDIITLSILKNGSTGVSVPQGELNIYTTIR